MFATATTQPEDDDPYDHEIDARVTDLLHRLGATPVDHPAAA